MTFIQPYTFTVVNGLSALTLGAGILAVILTLALIFKWRPTWIQWGEKNVMTLMLMVALTATLGSLFLSEIAGWLPCKDCWFQRIFMYPQVPLLIMAIWKKDKTIAPYILFLCLIGAAFSIDHYIDQAEAALRPIADAVTGVNIIPCDASGISCSETQIKFAFGYITIPMMALTAFVLNGIGSLFVIIKRKNNTTKGK